jgi:type II secretory pathway pseudopilin PulG
MTDQRPRYLRQEEAGYLLVEIIVSMLVTSIVVLALSPMMVRISRTASTSSTAVYEAAAISGEVSRLSALPYDSLATVGVGCVTVSTPPQPYQRCTTINNISAKVQQLIIVVTPSGNTLLKPDTVNLVRTKTGGTGVSGGTFP